MLEHGHQCVLDCRSRRNATKRPQIEAACRRQLSEDALAFLAGYCETVRSCGDRSFSVPRDQHARAIEGSSVSCLSV